MDHVHFEDELPRATVDDFEFEDRHKPLDLFRRESLSQPDEEFRSRVVSFDHNPLYNHNSINGSSQGMMMMARLNHQNATLSEIKDEAMMEDDSFRLGQQVSYLPTAASTQTDNNN